MDEPILTLALALVDALNAETWSPEITAELAFAPTLSRQNLPAPRCLVVPAAEAGDYASRSDRVDDLDVTIGVASARSAADLTEIRAQLRLVGDIKRHLETLEIPGFTLIRSAREPLFFTDYLQQDHVLLTPLTLTYRQYRELGEDD